MNVHPNYIIDEETKTVQAVDGLTLRDYFAAKALPAVINQAHSDVADQEIAMFAYLLADHMLAERAKQK